MTTPEVQRQNRAYRDPSERHDAQGGSALPLLWFSAIFGVLLTLWLLAYFTETDVLSNVAYNLAVPQHFDCPTGLC